jgi:hypothetical protein
MSQRHTHCRRGKRVMVVLSDGTRFIDKFLDNKGTIIEFENHRVRTEHVRSFVIYKPNRKADK